MKHLPTASCRCILTILLACWFGMAAAPQASAQQSQPIRSQSSSIAAGKDYTCAINPSGGVVCWGEPSYVVRGTSPAYPPVSFAELSSGVQAVVSGSSHACALKTTEMSSVGVIIAMGKFTPSLYMESTIQPPSQRENSPPAHSVNMAQSSAGAGSSTTALGVYIDLKIFPFREGRALSLWAAHRHVQ